MTQPTSRPTSHPPSRPTYIAIEGINGAGKTTVLASLEFDLQQLGHHVQTFHETVPPWVRSAGGVNGAFDIDYMEPKDLALLYTLARAYALARVGWSAGGYVLASRSHISTMVYQGQELGYDLMVASGLRMPDRVIFLDIPPALAWERVQGRHRAIEERLDEEHLEYDRACYLRALTHAPKPLVSILPVTADDTPRGLAQRVLELILA